MELVAIILIVFFIFLVRSFKKDYPEKKQTKSYKDYDVSKRSSPHPNDTVLGNAEPHESRKNAESQREVWKKIEGILGDFIIAGTYYRTLEEISRAENLQVNEELILLKEPTNNFDKNAIKVVTKDNYHLGYIPKNLCRMFYDILEGCEYKVFVNKIVNAPNAPYVHARVEILNKKISDYFCVFKYYPHICKS